MTRKDGSFNPGLENPQGAIPSEGAECVACAVFGGRHPTWKEDLDAHHAALAEAKKEIALWKARLWYIASHDGAPDEGSRFDRIIKGDYDGPCLRDYPEFQDRYEARRALASKEGT